MSLTSLGLLWRNLLRAPRCQWAQSTSGSCCRTRCSCRTTPALCLNFSHDSATEPSESPILFPHPPLNETKILTKPTGAIKASVQAGVRKQELQETLRAGDAGTGDAEVKAAAQEAQSSPQSSGISELSSFPSFPWAPRGALPVARGQRSHKSCAEQSCSKIQTT